MDLEFESGYVSIRNAPTLSKPRGITFQEGVALVLGLDLIASSLPNDRHDLLSAIDSLRQRLIDILGVPVKLSAIPTTSGEVVTTIANAIHSNGGLAIHYHSLYKDQISERTVIPIEIFELHNHQYLRAYCCAVQDFREFRIDRIIQATPTSIDGVMEAKSDEAATINFSITFKDFSRDMAERFAITDVQIGKTIELSSYSRQWIERSVMASGRAILLNSPSDIRAEVAKKAQLLLDRYKAE
jgi:proteasome accessory factor C